MATLGSKEVGTTAAALVGAPAPVSYHTLVKAAADNTGEVYVGLSDAVTAGDEAATDGYLLVAGQEVAIPRAVADDAAGIWVIASDASQFVSFLSY